MATFNIRMIEIGEAGLSAPRTVTQQGATAARNASAFERGHA
ncbi:hypothetical protein [Frigidibacter sp. SD6-1]|nr:hypothetical protein [Frigidibacter sp. SD6-1]